MADLEPGVILSPSTVAAMERLATPPRTAMTDQYKATTYEQWERQYLRDRVAALEAAQHNPRAAISRSQIEAAVSAVISERDTPAPGSVPFSVAPPNCRQRLLRDGKPYPKSSCEACGSLSPMWRQCNAALMALEPTTQPPASSLVERVADAIAAQATSAGIVNDRPARAAILEVAAWLTENYASDMDGPPPHQMLRDEVNR